ncbi:MAG: Fumarate reductase cytochrome b subunit [uncultured Sulfurovum sp.]|uniref:Fumarate reductase cytochrome b subunit n=1 Tax=uncultured Sulfurovum sp. TaxID=269237 RepID=A0A6S6SZB1_9BACT|nr:MAG: Fumarate reductase cytochrome b subunit [uncultured Sulfurovum sp.]
MNTTKSSNMGMKKSRMPARLDYFQSGSGLILGLFMWGHMLMVSSILVSKDFMYSVTKFFEGSFLFEGGAPILVSGFAFFIFVVFIVHAFLGMRKLPANYKQYKVIKETSSTLNHEDTKLWFIQAFTGFAMFFLGSIHIYIIMTNPDQIGPYASADRIWSGWMWPLFILLLLAVEFHGTIGLYRLCVKWGWFDGEDPRKTRKTLKKVKNYLTWFFLILGFTTLGAYMKIGYDHRHNVGERYVPSTAMVYQIDKVEVA